MARIDIVCTNCETPLSGGTDTFGSVNYPFCWECHSTLELQEDEDGWFYFDDDTEEVVPLANRIYTGQRTRERA